jgi:chromosome segregation ATPase
MENLSTEIAVLRDRVENLKERQDKHSLELEGVKRTMSDANHRMELRMQEINNHLTTLANAEKRRTELEDEDRRWRKGILSALVVQGIIAVFAFLALMWKLVG